MAIFHLYSNRHNIGDLFSALGIKKLLKGKNLTDLYWCDSAATRLALENLSSQDKLIVGGGGLLMDYFEEMWKAVLKVPSEALLVIWGIGFCHHKSSDTSLNKSLMKKIVERADLVAVRDRVTFEMLGEFSNKIRLSGCPSVVVAKEWKRRKQKYLLHVIHPELLLEEVIEWRDTANKLAKKSGLKYVEINHLAPRNELSRHLYLQALKYYYTHSKIVISSRLHGVILASALGVPLIPVSADHKIEAYWCETIGGETPFGKNEAHLLKETSFSIDAKKNEEIKQTIKMLIDENREITGALTGVL